MKRSDWAFALTLAMLDTGFVAYAVVICLMVPYSQININAPFSEAFTSVLSLSSNPSVAKRVFLHVASRIVSIGALTGEAVSRATGVLAVP